MLHASGTTYMLVKLIRELDGLLEEVKAWRAMDDAGNSGQGLDVVGKHANKARRLRSLNLIEEYLKGE
jgi:hypothetical protein